MRIMCKHKETAVVGFLGPRRAGRKCFFVTARRRLRGVRIYRFTVLFEAPERHFPHCACFFAQLVHNQASD